MIEGLNCKQNVHFLLSDFFGAARKTAKADVKSSKRLNFIESCLLLFKSRPELRFRLSLLFNIVQAVIVKDPLNDVTAASHLKPIAQPAQIRFGIYSKYFCHRLLEKFIYICFLLTKI